MIQFPATVEIFICLVVGLFAGFLVGWLFGSFLVAVVVGIGVMCWSLDAMFSYEVEDDGDWDDY